MEMLRCEPRLVVGEFAVVNRNWRRGIAYNPFAVQLCQVGENSFWGLPHKCPTRPGRMEAKK
jgi:hypothetical protein